MIYEYDDEGGCGNEGGACCGANGSFRTGHCRIINPKKVRVAWGERKKMGKAFKKVQIISFRLSRVSK